MKINCAGARAVMIERDILASGAKEYFEAIFTFDSEWDGLQYKYAVFKGSGETELRELDVNNTCKVPTGVMGLGTILYVGALGMDSDNMDTATVILTTNMVYAGTIPEGASTLAALARLLRGD